MKKKELNHLIVKCSNEARHLGVNGEYHCLSIQVDIPTLKPIVIALNI